MKQEFDEKRVLNQLGLYRIEAIKQHLRSCLKFSMQDTSEPAEETDPEEATEDAANEKKHLIALIDEILNERANKFLEKSYEENKAKMQQMQSLLLHDEHKEQEDVESDGSTSSRERGERCRTDTPDDYLETKRNIFNDIE